MTLWVKRSGLALLGLAAAFVALELASRVAHLDDRLIASAVVFQAADPEVHRISDDPFLHYELRPQSAREGMHPLTGRRYSVHIDEHGARLPTHSLTKAPGTFRVLAFGGSTLYGGAVNDDETLPAALERRWNASGGTNRLEVWNFGTSAYNLAQAAHLARAKLRTLSPDLILVQVHNRFPRPFFVPDSESPWESIHHFRSVDPQLMAEQLRPPDFLSPEANAFGSAHFALYRDFLALHQQHYRTPPGVSQQMSQDEARALTQEAQAQGVPIVFVQIPADRGQVPLDQAVYPGLPASLMVDLFQPGHDSDFYEVHPPPAVLDAYAALLIATLEQRQLLPRPSLIGGAGK